MRKLHKAAVVATVLGSVGILGGGTAQAAGMGGHSSWCKTHDVNVDVLGEIGILNGLLANLIGSEGSPGAQFTGLGSSCGK